MTWWWRIAKTKVQHAFRRHDRLSACGLVRRDDTFPALPDDPEPRCRECRRLLEEAW